MLLLADTHVHLYQCYDLKKFFSAAIRNFEQRRAAATILFKLDEDEPCTRLLFLTERHDCRFFDTLPAEDTSNSDGGAAKRIDETIIRLSGRSPGDTLFVVSGRQVVSKERVEVLLLNTCAEIPDGLPISEVLERICGSTARAVLSWSPGKWTFKRRTIIEDLIVRYSPKDFMLGDVFARPGRLPDPKLFLAARRRGFTLLGGSDPLPYAGEEENVARLITADTAGADFSPSTAEIAAWLGAAPFRGLIIGERSPLLQTAVRLFRNELSRRASRPQIACPV